MRRVEWTKTGLGVDVQVFTGGQIVYLGLHEGDDSLDANLTADEARQIARHLLAAADAAGQRSMTMAQALDAAERAPAQVAAWPKRKRDLSHPPAVGTIPIVECAGMTAGTFALVDVGSNATDARKNGARRCLNARACMCPVLVQPLTASKAASGFGLVF